MPADVVKALRESTHKVLEEAVARDALTKKVHESYMAYMDKYARWSALSEGVYHSKILKG